MSDSISSAGSTNGVQVAMLRKQMDAQASRSAQLLEGLPQSPAPAAAPPARPQPPSGTWYL